MKTLSLKKNKQHLTLYDSEVFRNFCKVFQVAVTFPVIIYIAICERSFSAMRRIKPRNCVNQDRFSNLSILNIEKIFVDNNEHIKYFEKAERRI